MPIPDIETWRGRWTGEQVRYLGVRGVDVGDGWTEFVVEQPYGDERDGDPLLLNTAITYAVDIAAVGAVSAHIDATREQANGTASLFLNFVGPAEGDIRVRAEVVHWATYQALVQVTAHDARGQLVAQGLSGYSLRPKAGSPEAGAESVK